MRRPLGQQQPTVQPTSNQYQQRLSGRSDRNWQDNPRDSHSSSQAQPIQRGPGAYVPPQARRDGQGGLTPRESAHPPSAPPQQIQRQERQDNKQSSGSHGAAKAGLITLIT